MSIDTTLKLNNEKDFARLTEWINHLKLSKRLNTEIVGMEPTGHYWLNLSKWLYDQDIDVVTVNPHFVSNKEV